MIVLKFGGQSLANGKGITHALDIIKEKYRSEDKIAVVLSARGDTTDRLEYLLESAALGLDYENELDALLEYQSVPEPTLDITAESDLLKRVLSGVKLVGDYSHKTKAQILAQGEVMSSKLVSQLLLSAGIKIHLLDTRSSLITDDSYLSAVVDETISKENIVGVLEQLEDDTIPVITGYIGSDKNGNTTTLGRNGTNYSASLIANFLSASRLESYTHIDGIFTTNPENVTSAKIIDSLTYAEAGELASFGASILHPKTIEPLVEKAIPLHILNTFKPLSKGTRVLPENGGSGVKAISVLDDVCLVSLEGPGLLGKVGIDGRIFSTLKSAGISVGIISQGSSERGVSFTIPSKEVSLALDLLHHEFRAEMSSQDIECIKAETNIAVITVIGVSITEFSASLNHLAEHNIQPLLINNTASGKNIALIVYKQDEQKTLNIIHSQIFGIVTTVNLAIFGVGKVGSSLIRQIDDAVDRIKEKRDLNLNIFALANSEKVLFPQRSDLSNDWQHKLKAQEKSDNVQAVLDYAEKNHLTNLILIDNTASEKFIEHYHRFLASGYDVISSNKIANTQSYKSYKALRQSIKKAGKTYLYETNVGAGLPIIDTINLLHQSGENITRIRGVFSGSLSYIFNRFSGEEVSFSSVIQDAMDKGYTEPDPREDLSGNDVARKLLILARELDLQNEFEEIKIDNLIPEALQAVDKETFIHNLEQLDHQYATLKESLEAGQVLRYVADLHGDLSQDKGILEVSLEAVPAESKLGGLSGSDSLIEIYTESYGENPITIIGAGAGAEVTARGVLGDILRIGSKK